MKLIDPASLGFLLLPFTQALQLPFGIPGSVQGIRSTLGASFKVPEFIKKFADPISTSPLYSLHRSLIEIPSVTGNEKGVGEWLAAYLMGKNFTVETQAVSEDRVNIFAYLGKNRTTHTLVTSHIDTVPPFIPYKATSNTIYGRGSNDAKGSVASQIIAVEELITEEVISEGDVSLLFVVGEETLGDGMKTANSLGPKWRAVIFGEPTENKLAVGHKGIVMFDVIAKGKASHSGYPQLGVNANSHLIEALYKIEHMILPKSDLLGESTINIGLIQGGVAANIVSPYASASVLIRLAGDLDETLEVIKKTVHGLPVELKFLGVTYGPQETDHDVENFETIICSYGTDVPNLHGDHKRYLYGPGSIFTAHSGNEYILKSDLTEAVAGYKRLIKESLWPTKRVPAIVDKVIKEETVIAPVSRSAIVGDKSS
ncbi:hypothetical protein B9Z19DRAFT_628266 [Tuber borchii]|uniref:Peptidase M20 dimerisation domain-containing protein n=1 Tax=Tuber borchii TaxID=42251 RepID=A0A2T7A0R4_TUBBO|nr:hypothetical protein B9Z19DRAFT_628266 [Tuber borchii]